MLMTLNGTSDRLHHPGSLNLEKSMQPRTLGPDPTQKACDYCIYRILVQGFERGAWLGNTLQTPLLKFKQVLQAAFVYRSGKKWKQARVMPWIFFSWYRVLGHPLLLFLAMRFLLFSNRA